MVSAVKLPFSFDPARLKQDLFAIPVARWTAHFNQNEYEGRWSGVALRGPAGANPLYPDPQADTFVDTPVMADCPYFREVLAAFECPLQSVRLLNLAAGSSIREHRDFHMGFEDGEARIHIPIQTSPEVEFVLDGRRILLEEGTSWYLDFRLPHLVRNRGSVDRIHLVIDARVNDWVRSVLEGAQLAVGMDFEAISEPDEALGGFAEFRRRVLEDPSLQERLRGGTDADRFADAVVALGRAEGYGFTRGDVQDAVRRARRAWIDMGLQ